MNIFYKDNLEIHSPLEIYNIKTLQILKEVGKFGEVQLSAGINNIPNSKNNYISIKINNIIVFKGCIDKVSFFYENNQLFVKLKALGHTNFMNWKSKSRSFQNKNNKYSNIFKDIVVDNYGGILIDNHKDIQESMIVQYNETDFNFLSRLASIRNTKLTINDTFDFPAICVGKPEGQKITINYISSYTIFKNTVTNNLKEKKIEIECLNIANLGDYISDGSINGYVCKINHNYINGAFTHKYLLTNEDYFYTNSCFHNKYISGISLSGEIIDVKEDVVKLHLDIDDSQDKQTAKWHKVASGYTAENNAGWYVMPQIGDHAMLYFPDKHEDKAFVKNIYRPFDGNNYRHSDPDIKRWGTPDYKELKMSNDSVKLSAEKNHTYVELNENSGISMKSFHKINISSGQHIALYADKIKLKTERKDFEIITGDSIIRMDINTDINSPMIKEKGNQ